MEELKCIKTLYMDAHAIEGKSYEVVYEDDEEIIITNEHGRRHHFLKDSKSEAYYGIWFSAER